MKVSQCSFEAQDATFGAWLSGRVSFEGEECLLAEGSLLAGYRITSFLGRGGSGEVCAAHHEKLGSTAAIKILYKDTPSMRVRFEREAKILAEKRYREFPQFIAYGEYEGYPYLIEELLVSRQLPFTDKDVAEFLIKVATAVGRLHEMGYIHRDIKPDNILWRKIGEPVLIDFGLACVSVGDAAGGDHRAPHPFDHALSVQNGEPLAIGTLGYAAPEQLIGGKVDAATDIHALGVLANACFANNPSRAWSRIIRRSASSVSSQRYRSTDEFIHAIRNRHRARNWLVGLGGFSVVCVAVIVTAIFALNVWWDRSMKLSGRVYPSDRSFSILPIDETELMPLDELGIAGWGMGGADDCPVVFVQRLAYAGDFSQHRELQSQLGATYGGRTTVCEEEVSNAVLRVEIENWREGERLLYAYRKLFVDGKVIYQVTGQTQMRTKARDRDKLKMVVDSFKTH